MKNTSLLQGIISIVALVCLAIGWFQLLSPELNDLFYNKLFYILIGLSFLLASQSYSGPYLKYITYAAAAMCIIGPFLPEQYSMVKTVGLLAGVVVSFTNRPNFKNRPRN